MASDSEKVPAPLKFLCAAGAGVAGTLVCFPLDVLKLNMQVSGEMGSKREQTTTFQFARQIYRDHGLFPGLYAGLSASVLRQSLYTGGRLGLFQVIYDEILKRGHVPTFPEKCMASCVAGSVGAVLGLPPDVVLTRMAVDPRLERDKRRNYKHVFNGLSRIYREEGMSALYRGLGATVFRAMVLNVSQLGSYFQVKQFLIENDLMKDDTLCQFICSVVASFVATTCVLPADIAKTRIQNMKVIGGQREYKGMFDVWWKIVRYEGLFALWKGYTPTLMRNAPQSVVTLLVYEKLISQVKNFR